MGWSASFVAVKGLSKAEAIARLGEQDTGQPEPQPSSRDAFSAGVLPSGWALIWSDDCLYVTPERLAAVSAGTEAVGLRIDDHMMAADAWGYRDSVEVWAIPYDCEDGPDITPSGAPPPAYDAVYAEARRRQVEENENDNVDYVWDVPADVFRSVCGFRYDEHLPDGVELTRLVRAPAPPTRGLLARLFGGG